MDETNEKNNVSSAKQDENIKKVLEYLKEISKNINSAISLLESSSVENKSEIIEELSKVLESTPSNTSKEILPEKYKENTLLISYSNNNVTLPYTLEELESILASSDGKYNNVEDVINDLYTIPLDYYKHTPFSRFKEAFKLVKERNHGSLKDALDLAIEMFSNYNLHPAVITACKNIDEFDVYLSCLEYNELEDFHFFNIEFNMPPLQVKK